MTENLLQVKSLRYLSKLTKKQEETNLRFIDKCPMCGKDRNGQRDPEFHHLIIIICKNPLCEFKTIQTLHEEDYIIDNNILNYT